ncbi:MAG: SDR family NAD(P)-dependent oxidoreductase [Mycobacteriales bacterium]
MDYRGQVCVVTGASSGIGRRLALDLARAGGVVVAVARREDLLAALVKEMAEASPAATYRCADLAQVDDFAALLAEVEAEFGRIDVLINNAATGGTVPRDSTRARLEQFRAAFEVNYFAAVAGMLAVLPGMQARRHGVIANVSSDDARAPGPGGGDYAGSKAALAATTESIAHVVRGTGVHLHVVYPAWVPTAMGQGAVDRGVMPLPPRPARRTEEQVSALVLRRLTGPRLEINAAAVTLLAPLARTFFPVAYQRARARF